MKRFLALLICLLPALAFAGVVYKYIDKQGNTVYTDQPRPGAQRVDRGSGDTGTEPLVS